MIVNSENRANGIRVYTNKTRLRGLKNWPLKSPYLLQSAEADIVCIDAVSTAVCISDIV